VRDPALQRVLVLMGPGTVGLAATQANVFINTILATSQGTGAVSWLNYAFRLMYLPIGLFGVSVATAVLPAVSRRTAQGDHAGVRRTVSEGMSLMMVLNIPATVGLVLLATPIIRLIFERRAFTAADTAATAGALQFYAIGLVGYSIVRIVSPIFYALGQNRTPVLVSVAAVAVNIAASLTLVRLFGYRGLALATSIAALFNASVLLVLLHRRLNGLDEARTLASLARILIASAAMGATAVLIDGAVSALIPGAQLAPQVARLAITIGCSLLVLAAAAWALRIREFTEAMALATRLRRPPSTDHDPADAS
jgi:putative peptidoglycan lipid II flippase